MPARKSAPTTAKPGKPVKAHAPQARKPALDRSAVIRDRVVELRRVPASELIPNSHNWREHPEIQRELLREVLQDVGFAGAELVRQLPDGRLMLIDGHLRQEEMGDQPIPVLVTDLTEAESDAMLASYDPIARLATANQQRTADLLARIQDRYSGMAHLLAASAATAQDSMRLLLTHLAESALPEFAPVGEDEQGRLDQKAPVECPHCGYRFSPA